MTKPLPDSHASRSDGFAKQVARLAHRLADPDFPTGEHAAIRRMDPTAPGPALLALHRLLAATGIDPPRLDEQRWALLAHSLALAHGRHDPAARSGKTLHAIGVTEARLSQLLAADFDVLTDLLPRLARRLAATGQAIDWLPFALLALHAGRPGYDEQSADRARLDIARSYARAADTP